MIEVQQKCCKDCRQTLPLKSFPYRKPRIGKGGGYGPRCIECAKKHDCERGQNYRDRMASPNTGFDGYRKEDRDAPFPEQGVVFRGWRGPVGEWRVRL